MPCDSSIVRTNMTDRLQLTAALEAEGWRVDRSTENSVVASRDGIGIGFSRSRTDQPFCSIETNGRLAIQRKYSEIGVRKWAAKANFSITEFDGQKMTLVNRRG